MDRTWNVIDEDDASVTLLLNENLGDTVAWLSNAQYQAYDSAKTTARSNYGPVTALTYLNTLTKDWTVDNIESYGYVNNKKGLVRPIGYQELEIENGVTTIVQFNSNKVTIEGETKARILTREEVFEIAQKVNTNLTEENLRAYIERNLSTVNAGLGTSIKTVDEGIEFATQIEGFEGLQYETKYVQTYYTVWMIGAYGIETTYDISLPEFLYKNLYTSSNTSLPYGYWTLSSDAYDSRSAWYVKYSGNVNCDNVDYVSHSSVRPVITISKSQLS